MGMNVVAPGAARTRRLSCLLAGTALVSVAALSMAVTDAVAQCTVSTTGIVDCLANTTTTDTINTNGGTPSSSDKRQEFDNGSNITGTIATNVTVDGFGLQLALTNAAPPTNTIDVTNSGTVTTNQANALELNGNGGLVTYTGSGTVSATAGGGNAMVVTNIGAGAVTVTNNGVFSSANNHGLFIETAFSTGTITVNGSGSIAGGSNGISADADGAANINITSGGSHHQRHRRGHRRAIVWRQCARCHRQHRVRRQRRDSGANQPQRHGDGHHRRRGHQHIRLGHRHHRGERHHHRQCRPQRDGPQRRVSGRPVTAAG